MAGLPPATRWLAEAGFGRGGVGQRGARGGAARRSQGTAAELTDDGGGGRRGLRAPALTEMAAGSGDEGGRRRGAPGRGGPRTGLAGPRRATSKWARGRHVESGNWRGPAADVSG